MSAKQVYWDLLHVEKKLVDFSDCLWGNETIDTKRYNTEFYSALHRVRTAQEYMKSVIGREACEELNAEFSQQIAALSGGDK